MSTSFQLQSAGIRGKVCAFLRRNRSLAFYCSCLSFVASARDVPDENNSRKLDECYIWIYNVRGLPLYYMNKCPI